MNKELINFVQWLPDNSEMFSGLTFEESINLINEMITSEEGKQSLEQLTKQYKSMELFKKGGKLDYLLCLKHGGPMDCGCGKKIEKAQGGSGTALDQERYPEKTVERRDRYGFFSRKYNDKGHRVEKMTSKTPEGVVMETTRTISPMDTNYVVGPANKPLDFQTYVTPYAYSQMGPLMKLLNKPAPAEWGPLFDSYQEGGKMSRKEALGIAEGAGFSRKQARQGYRTAKNYAHQQGIWGSDARQQARQMVAQNGIRQIINGLDPIIIEDEPIVVENVPITLNGTPISQLKDDFSNVVAMKTPAQKQEEARAQLMAQIAGAANRHQAFRIARNAGLDKFDYNGQSYHTKLDTEMPGYKESTPAVQQTVEIPVSQMISRTPSEEYRGYSVDKPFMVGGYYRMDSDYYNNVHFVLPKTTKSTTPVSEPTQVETSVPNMKDTNFMVGGFYPMNSDYYTNVPFVLPKKQTQSQSQSQTQQQQSEQLPVGWYGQFMINK